MWDRYYLGSSYYPEWWDRSEWEANFRQMRELGFNTVRMGEFAWAFFEPSEGKFDFEWMDEAIALANRHQIDVMMCTPTASIPPWLHQSHPDVLGGNEKGPYTYGGRKGYCVNSPSYLEASARVTAAMAEHYGRHSGIIGWQLDNEPGAPFLCYDPHCEQAFRVWLEKRYGTLDALNKAWGGAFWSNYYTDWSQIGMPVNSAENGWQPGSSLDYRRFFSDSYLEHLRRQADILRQHVKDQFIFTNWPNTTWSVDPFSGGEFLDATTWDNYCGAPGTSAYGPPKHQDQYYSGFHNDIARCAGPNQRFFIAEQMAYIPPHALQEGLRVQAYVNLAHGSYGAVYFEWRRPPAGIEQERPSMVVRYDGTVNPAKPVFEQIGVEMAKLGPRLAGATTRADIALLYDFSNEWAQGFWSGANGYDQEALRYYRGFKALQRNIDVVPLTTNLSSYRLVVAPGLVMVDDHTAERLRAYVAAGGTLVLNYRAGTRNMANGMRRSLGPGPFAEMAGVVVEASVAGYVSKENLNLHPPIDIAFAGSKEVFTPRTILEAITLRGADPIGKFVGGRMDGWPAITCNRYGEGVVFYVGTDSAGDEFHEALARAMGAASDLSPLISAPHGVEVCSRETPGTIYYFLMNLTEDSNAVSLPRPMEDVIGGRDGVTEVALAPLGVAVLAEACS